MPKTSSRPADLPDYTNHPLNEVVLGVQFAPPTGYKQILAGEVWGLFKRGFPIVEEVMPIAPAFETFGILQPQPVFNFSIVGPQHSRFWFLAERKDDLIQFQSDRLLHNWRKVGDRTNEYPRFEKMIKIFSAELNKLEKYFNSLSPQTLVCNQAEISYINHITMDNLDELSDASRWFRFLNFDYGAPDEISADMRHVIRNATGAPMGRLFCELNTGINPSAQKIFVLTLTFRGAPEDTTLGAALDFLKQGRELIVNKFAAIITDWAREVWERAQ